MIVWPYGKEGSGLIVQGIRVLRAVTTRLPHFLVASIAHFLALALDLYLLACRHISRLPLSDYVTNVVGQFSRSKRYLVVYDQLKPAYAKYYIEAEALFLHQTAFPMFYCIFAMDTAGRWLARDLRHPGAVVSANDDVGVAIGDGGGEIRPTNPQCTIRSVV
jgi:hypothetical protein